MRILMVAPQPYFRARGTPFSILHRLRALTRLGHTVDLVTYPFGDTPDVPAVTVHRAARPWGISDVGIGPSVAKILLDGPLSARAWALVRSRRFDMLHTHEEGGIIGAWISRAVGLPHVYDMHSSLPEQFVNYDRFNWRPVISAFRALERYTLKHSDGVIAVCPALRDLVVASGYDGPVAVIENTVNASPPAEDLRGARGQAERLGVGGARVVLYAGTLEPNQGLDLVIEAAPQVARAVPDARFLIVGGNARQARPLEKLAERRGIAGVFRFVPQVAPPEIWRYYTMADVLVSCRIRGLNTPLKLYQYVASGKPIVATACPSHTQVLDRSSAELVEPTPGALAAGIIRVLSNPARAAELVAGAARLGRERLREEIYLDRLASLLAEVAGAVPRGERMN